MTQGMLVCVHLGSMRGGVRGVASVAKWRRDANENYLRSSSMTWRVSGKNAGYTHSVLVDVRHVVAAVVHALERGNLRS